MQVKVILLQSLIAVACLLTISNNSNAQIDLKDTTVNNGVMPQFLELLNNKIGEKYTNFAINNDLLTIVDLTQIFPNVELSNSSDSIKNPSPTKIKNTTIHFGNYFGNYGLNVSENESQTKLSFASDVTLNGMPINISGRMILRELTVDKQLSNLNLSFNSRSFLKQKHSDLTKVKINELINYKEGLKDQLDNLNDLKLSNRELEIIQNEIYYLLLQSIITNPDYTHLLEEGNKKLNDYNYFKDSLNVVIDSFRVTKENVTEDFNDSMNNALASLHVIEDSLKIYSSNYNEKVENLMKFQQEYQDIWDNRRSYYGDTLQLLKQKLNQTFHQNREVVLKQTRDQILKDGSSSILDKLAATTEKFHIGQSNLNSYWYVADNLPVNGIQYSGGIGHWNTEVLFGRQVYNTAFTTIWNSDLFTKARGANVSYLNVSYQADSLVEISASHLRMRSQGFSEGPFLELPFENAVTSIDADAYLLKSLQLHGSLSYSTMNGGNDIENQVLTEQSSDDIAGELTVGGEIVSGINVEAGYFFIGPDYSSRGNPFIQSNRNGLVFKLNGSIKKKLDFGMDLKMGSSIDESEQLGDNQKTLQLYGHANYEITQNWLASLQLSPNTFKYFGSGNISYSGSNTIYNFQITNLQTIGNFQSISSAGFTNFNSELHYIDTTSVNSSDQFFIQNALMISNTRSINTTLMYGVNQGNNFDTEKLKEQSYFLQIDYGIERETISTSIGGQFMKNYVSPGYMYGISSAINWKLDDNIIMDMQANYQFSLKQENQSGNRFWAGIGLKMQL